MFGNLFLSVGAMKAGTTWLYAVLERHPELFFSMEKEIHYFYHKYVDPDQLSDARRLDSARKRYLLRFDPERANIDRVRDNLHWVSAYLSRPVDDHWFRNLFHQRPHHTYACEFSNLTAHIPTEGWTQIHEQSKKLRVLYTMRDPIKRLWSHTKFHMQVTDRLDELKEWGPGDYEFFVAMPHIWDNAEYGQVLKRMKDGLPEECYKAIFYEDIHKDQRAMLKGLEDFLEIKNFDYPQHILDKRFTESAKIDMPDFFPDLFRSDVERIKNEVTDAGFTVPEKWT